MSKYTELEKRILQVLAYAAVFHDAVDRHDLERYMPGDTLVSQEELNQVVEQLVERDVIRRVEKHTSPEVVQQKWRSVARAIQFLQRFRMIESVWVTGGLAVGNVQADDDIDLMIITTPHSLWLTRALVSVADLFTQRIRRRSDNDSGVQDKWCCNLWLESTSCTLEEQQRSLYSAREVIQARPVFQRRSGMAVTFLRLNAWVSEWFPVGFEQAVQRANTLRTSPSVAMPGLPWLNSIAFWLQTQRMRSYQQHEIVEYDRAFFHPGERAKEVQTRYEKILQSLFSMRATE